MNFVVSAGMHATLTMKVRYGGVDSANRYLAVDKPERRKFLGVSFYYRKGEVRIRVHEKPIRMFQLKVKEVTSRSNAMSMAQRITKLNQSVVGWINYIGNSTISTLKSLDTKALQKDIH